MYLAAGLGDARARGLGDAQGDHLEALGDRGGVAGVVRDGADCRERERERVKEVRREGRAGRAEDTRGLTDIHMQEGGRRGRAQEHNAHAQAA
jgi:hypothetical protein